MATFERHPRRLTRAMAGSGVALLALSGATALNTGASYASSHREAPLIAGDPRADNTDLYAFVSPDKSDSVTLVSNWYPMQEPNGGPNFYPFAENTRYNIKIDNDGDGKANIRYSWVFTNHYRNTSDHFLYNTGVVNSVTDKTLNFYQTYNLWKTTYVAGKPAKPSKVLVNAIVAPSFTGKASMPNYAALREQAVKTYNAGKAKSFAGQADDPFFLDLRVFDLLYGTDLKETGQDTLSGFNVNTIALQVPKSELALKGNATNNPVVGIWSTTDRRGTQVLGGGTVKSSGAWKQVSRLGNPLVNEVVIPLKYKDAFNAINPSQDASIAPVVAKVTDPIVPKLIESIYGIKAPKTPRNDLVEIFLTGIAKNAPTLDGSKAPIQADLNSQILNKDADAKKFRPSEMLRLNMAVPVAAAPNRLGVIGADLQGFPNGRRLTDDVVDIGLQALEGAAQTGEIVAPLATGDSVNANDKSFGTTFPYVALPNDDAVNVTTTSPVAGAAAPASSGMSGMGALAPAAGAVGIAFLLGSAVLGMRRRMTAQVPAVI